MQPFVHLAARTTYSLRDSLIRPRELAVGAWQGGMDTVGIADRGGLYGAVRVAEACKVTGVRPLFGADLALAPDAARPGWGLSRAGRSRGVNADGSPAGPGSGSAWLEDDAARVIMLARDSAGYAQLCRAISDHHLESPRSDAHLTWKQLERRAGWSGGAGGWGGGAGQPGLFLLLGDDSPVARLLDEGRPDAAEEEARRWMDLFGREAVLVGVTHHLAPGDDARARARFGLADRLGLRAVAHQAPRYLRPRDARIADVLDAIRQQVPLSQRHARRRNAEGFLKTPEEMGRVFTERPDALSNTAWVAERCDVDLGLGRLRAPDYADVGDGGDRMEVLRARSEAGIRERYPAPGRRHRELLERELAMVTELGLAPYFLTVAEIVERIREKGIMVACRGSAAGSLIIYALRISDVDPIAHDLTFERFMNPYRDELPDIDLDVESARREDIYRDLLDRYGDDRVACVCMVERFKARMAIREVGKVMGLPAVEIDHVAKSFPHIRAGDVRAALEHLPELSGSNLNAGQLGFLFDVVECLDSLPRHIALHPSGVLLADRTLRDFVPLERSAAGFAMAQFDKDDVEALGLCKLDVLAVRMLSSMAHCLDEVRRVRGADVDLATVPWHDEDTYELIRSTRTLGMFQIESPGQRELIGKFQPEHIDDLVVDISLFRPGPVKGDMVGPFLQRRLGKAKTVYPHPILERALAETYGVIVYHEQVMRAVAAVTGCDLAVADLARRRLGDPDELPRLHEWVLSGAIERGVSEDVAESLWHALVQFASFGFCKAHAAAFSVPTYRSAWLKAHFMPEFVAGLLTHDPGMYPRRLLLDDARQFGIAVLGLDVNRSARDYRVERLPADDAYALLGVAGDHLPPGWHRGHAGEPVPPAGFDFGDAGGGTSGRGRRKGASYMSLDSDEAAGGGASGRWRFGIRLALQDVARIDDRMIDSLLAGRPFTSVADVRRRAALSAPVAEALAHAGALDEPAGVGLPTAAGRVRTRRDVLLEVGERWSGVTRPRRRAGRGASGAAGAAPQMDQEPPQQLGLLPDLAAETAGLAEYRASERVRAELEVLGLDASRHVIRFYDSLLDRMQVTRAVDLHRTRQGQRIRVAGVKVATQTPPVKSGQRIIFLSLDDATGVSDATFFESVHDRCAWTVFHTWLLVVEGTVHRAGRRGISVNAEVAWDLRRLMRSWREGRIDEALAEQRPVAAAPHAAGRAAGDPRRAEGDPARKLWHASSGSAGG